MSLPISAGLDMQIAVNQSSIASQSAVQKEIESEHLINRTEDNALDSFSKQQEQAENNALKDLKCIRGEGRKTGQDQFDEGIGSKSNRLSDDFVQPRKGSIIDIFA